VPVEPVSEVARLFIIEFFGGGVGERKTKFLLKVFSLVTLLEFVI
jgi:hypothetical protein